jgi:hypothetical protein
MAAMFYKLEEAEIKIIMEWFGDRHHNFSERSYPLNIEELELAQRLNNFLGDEDRAVWVDELTTED